MHFKPLQRIALAAAIGLGLVAALPSQAQNRRDRNNNTTAREDRTANERQADRSGEEYSEPIKFKEIPERVRNKIEDVKKDDKVVNAYRVHVQGKDNYRVVTQHKGSDRIILASDTGQITNVEDVRGAELASFKQDPDTWLRDYDERMFGRVRTYAREADHVTGTPQNPEQINLDQVPGAARATLLREAAGDRTRLANTIRYKDNQGNVIYQCNIPDDPSRPASVHMVQVTPDGRVFNEADFNNRGQKLGDDWRPRALCYDDLPRDVQATVDREAPRGRIPHIDVARRGGHEIYTVQVDERDRTRYLTLDDRGKVLSDVSERYDTTDARPNRDTRR